MAFTQLTMFDYALVDSCPSSRQIATLNNGFEQFQQSDQDQVTLKDVDFDASGSYYCEVSTDTPIFTKGSEEEPMQVIRKHNHFNPEALIYTTSSVFWLH